MFCASFTCTALNHIQTEKWIALTYNTRTLFISLFCELDENLWREMVRSTVIVRLFQKWHSATEQLADWDFLSMVTVSDMAFLIKFLIHWRHTANLKP